MNAATRGVILAVVAVVVGVLILGQGFDTNDATLVTAAAPAGDDGSDDSAADSADDSADDTAAPSDDGGDDGGDGADTSDNTEPDPADSAGTDAADDLNDPADPDDGGASDVPDILHPANEVRVLVANGTGVAGAAGRVRDSLVAASGYGTLTPTNATSTADATSIYYAPGYELDARQIAKTLNAAPEAVGPVPAEVPVDDLLEADVLVVIGLDFDGLQ